MPDSALEITEKQARVKFLVEFSTLKICSKISRLGKDVKFLYDALDKDKSGSLEAEEILTGLKNSFGMHFSAEEVDQMAKYLDEDGSGDVTYEEFAAKINYQGYFGKAH